MGTLPSSHSNRVRRVGFEFGSWGSARSGRVAACELLSSTTAHMNTVSVSVDVFARSEPLSPTAPRVAHHLPAHRARAPRVIDTPLSDRRTCACADLAPRIVAHRAIHRFAVFTLPCEVRCSHALMALHVPSCLSALRLCARKARLRRLWRRSGGCDCRTSRGDSPRAAGWGSDVRRSVFVARSIPSTRSSGLACALYIW